MAKKKTVKRKPATGVVSFPVDLKFETRPPIEFRVKLKPHKKPQGKSK